MLQYSELEAGTIAAISTGNVTNAGISIVRMSGPEAIAIADRIFVSVHEKTPSGEYLANANSHTIHYGHIYSHGTLVDEVLLMLMKAPNTYTREDVVEINCHGGMLVTRAILETCYEYGARPAEAGEFTKRAFLNGRMDLSQAEAVIDLIEAKNQIFMKASLNQLEGKLSSQIAPIRESLLNDCAHIEAALDDPEHIDLEGFSTDLKNRLYAILENLQRYIDSFSSGKIVREGIRTVILGKPNAGKSSLLNALSRCDRAIVTDIPGTTRDTIEEQIRLKDMLLNLVDTAGIRDASDQVESIGVDKSLKCAEDADLILYVVDCSTPLDANDSKIMDLIRDKNVIVILNKSDLDEVVTEEDLFSRLSPTNQVRMIHTSMVKEEGLELLEETLYDLYVKGRLVVSDDLVLVNDRQKNALVSCVHSIEQVLQSIELGLSEDFYTIDLMNAYAFLGRITGDEVEDDLANQIFEKFCMGK
ncbi:MAG: tRNA uridine-5-carboxymethylaminomethyl(34) synthesis GTPase MnmE [Lachnospiraceae bacterium]|nr:tRNA uridine-5-carboxymethylaminomethyl(34) synthesis GTPase MnmE [Lachnospiraceae bacterium]